METNKIKVNIFGNTYSIQGDAPPEYILQLSEFVNDKMEEVNKNISNANHVQIAILAALNIADEYFQLREVKSGLTSVLEKKTRSLISMLDNGLIGDVLGQVDTTQK